MKIIACYDNGGKTFDRYTVVLSTREDDEEVTFGSEFECLGVSSNPEDPQGLSNFDICQIGKHLGRGIQFEELPENVQKHVLGRIA